MSYLILVQIMVLVQGWRVRINNMMFRLALWFAFSKQLTTCSQWPFLTPSLYNTIMAWQWFDFVNNLSSSNGFDVILIVVNQFTKMIYFLPCSKVINNRESIDLVMHKVFRYHDIFFMTSSNLTPRDSDYYVSSFTWLFVFPNQNSRKVESQD